MISDHHCDPHQPRAMTTTGRKIWLSTKSSLMGVFRFLLGGIRPFLHSESFHVPTQTLKFEQLEPQLHQHEVTRPSWEITDKWFDGQEGRK